MSSTKVARWVGAAALLAAPAFRAFAADAAPAGDRLVEARIAGAADGPTSLAYRFHPLDPVQREIILVNRTDTAQPYTYRWEVAVGGHPYTGEEDTGEVGAGATLRLPLAFKAPAHAARKTDGQIKLIVKIGDRILTDDSRFRVFGPAPASMTAKVALFDPLGDTGNLLRRLGGVAQPLGTDANPPVIMVGYHALASTNALPVDLQSYVRNGGRLIVMAQTRDWLQNQAAFRIAETPARRFIPVMTNHPALRGLDAQDLSDWNPAPRPPAPSSTNAVPSDGEGTHPPPAGAGGPTLSLALQKPDLSGWRPILECDGNAMCSPLMELEYGDGRVVLFTLDVERCAAADPAAEQLVRQIIDYARTAAPRPRCAVTYLGDDDGARLLTELGVVFRRANTVPADVGDLLVLGNSPVVDPLGLNAFIEKGGQALCLPARQTNAWLRIGLIHDPQPPASPRPPSWPEAAGITPADLRGDAGREVWRLAPAPGIELGAGGLLGRKQGGSGVLIAAQTDPGTGNPSKMNEEARRRMRVLARLLSNMGATLAADHVFFAALRGKTSRGKAPTGHSHSHSFDEAVRP